MSEADRQVRRYFRGRRSDVNSIRRRSGERGPETRAGALRRFLGSVGRQESRRWTQQRSAQAERSTDSVVVRRAADYEARTPLFLPPSGLRGHPADRILSRAAVFALRRRSELRCSPVCGDGSAVCDGSARTLLLFRAGTGALQARATLQRQTVARSPPTALRAAP